MKDGIEHVQCYDLALVPGYKIKKKKKKDKDKKLKEVQAADADAAPGSEVKEPSPLHQPVPIPHAPAISDAAPEQTLDRRGSADFKIPRIHLGFQLITPC